jgi:hypothetical protein
LRWHHRQGDPGSDGDEQYERDASIGRQNPADEFAEIVSKTPRPSSTAASMVAKLSSVRIMSAASFETSVPVIPMAIPMSA